MVFYKKVEVRVLDEKLGDTQRGLYAMEAIKAGEKIWHCNCGEKGIPELNESFFFLILEKHLD
jgi:hypothetical protein